MEKDSIGVFLPIHNQELIIERVINGILDNASDMMKQFLIIFDGCTDNSYEVGIRTLDAHKRQFPKVDIIEADDIWEVECCNVALKYMQDVEYLIDNQDDVIIVEKDFDQRMLKPFKVVPNLFAVSGRDAVDATIGIDGKLNYYNVAGKDVNTPRNQFSIRDVVNRAPLMFNNAIVRDLGGFDLDFCPIIDDDTDLCLRAYRKGYVCGSFVIDYISELKWGNCRRNVAKEKYVEYLINTHNEMIVERHKDLLIAEKHSRDIIID